MEAIGFLFSFERLSITQWLIFSKKLYFQKRKNPEANASGFLIGADGGT